MRTFLTKIVFRINIVAALLLLLSCLSVYITPQFFWPVAFLGLAYPFLLVTNIAFAVLWAIKWKRQFFLSFLAIALGYTFFIRIIQIHTPWNHKKQTNIHTSFKILSFNVRLFNLYNWTPNNRGGHEIIKFTEKEAPDIICFQEFYTREKGTYSEAEIFKNLPKNKYRHIKYTFSKKGVSNFGIATLSRYPIISKGEIPFDNTYNACIYSDLRIGNDTIRVYNNHLQSVRFLKQDYDFIDTLKLKYDSRNFIGFLDITFRLKQAFVKRAQQAKKIAAHIKSSPFPVIVCGDFNDSPVSYTYQKIQKNLVDAFMESGTGFGNTYLGKFPSFRIDYILHDKNLSSSNYRSPKIELSDHYPVVCFISTK